MTASESDPGSDVAPPAAAAAAVTGLGRERRRFTHTTEAQRRCMVEWLEQPPNFQLLARRAPPVRTAEGRKLKKADGFRALQRHVNARAGAEWDLETTRSRYESLLQTYLKARRAIESPDFGLSAADRARGVASLRHKRETLCRFYDRLDALHATGGRPLERREGDDNDENETENEEEHDESAEPPLPVTEAVQRENVGGGLELPTMARGPVLTTVQDTVSTALGGDADVSAASPPAKRLRRQYANGAGASDTADSRRASVEPSGSSRRSSLDQFGARRSSEYEVDGGGENDAPTLKAEALNIEVQRLMLQQEQLRLQQRELDLKEREVAAQESMRKQSLRADLTAKLVVAGKSLEEIREYLALLDG